MSCYVRMYLDDIDVMWRYKMIRNESDIFELKILISYIYDDTDNDFFDKDICLDYINYMIKALKFRKKEIKKIR